MGWARGHGWLDALGATLLGGGLLVWIIGALSGSLIFEAFGQIVYGLGWAIWGIRMLRKPVAAANRTSQRGSVWLIIAGIGFAAMTIIDLAARCTQD